MGLCRIVNTRQETIHNLKPKIPGHDEIRFANLGRALLINHRYCQLISRIYRVGMPDQIASNLGNNSHITVAYSVVAFAPVAE
jgi:hypothetical protein